MTTVQKLVAQMEQVATREQSKDKRKHDRQHRKNQARKKTLLDNIQSTN
jgi:hypothetical protein